MKLDDVIAQVQSQLPKYTEDFSDVVNITDAEIDGFEITLTVDDDLVIDTIANIKGVYSKLLVTAIEAGDEANEWLLTTEENHDQTYSDIEIAVGVVKTLVFVGDFADSKTLVEVPANNQILISSTVEPTGTFYLLEDRQYSGRKTVVIDNDEHTVKYTIERELEPYVVSGTVMNNIRIDAISSEEDMMDYIETETVALDKNSIYVMMGPRLASSDKFNMGDSKNRKKTSEDLKTECYRNVALFVVIPTQNDSTPRKAINYSDTIFPYILKCMHGAVFDSGLTEDKMFCCTYTGDDGESYNKAIYIHRFDFETVMNITGEDSVPAEYSSAFRSFEISVKLPLDDYAEVKKEINGDIP